MKNTESTTTSTSENTEDLNPNLEESKPASSNDGINKRLVEYTQKILLDPSNNSLTKKYLSLTLAEQELNVRTVENVGLGQCIYVNYNNPYCKYPYAASADCYCVFCDFFGPLTEDIHGPPQDEACLEPKYGDIGRYELSDLNLHDRGRVIYSDITLRRNLENIPFTPMMSDRNRKQVIEQLEKLFRKTFQGSEEIAEIPVEWELKFDRIKNELDDMGVMKNYPSDRLHLVYQTSDDLYQGIVLNFDDHLQIITSSYDGRIGRLYSRMYEVYTDGNLDPLDYVAHPFLGFLTLSPTYIGTGFTIRIIAKFPFLSRMTSLEKSILKNHDVIIEPENPECLSAGLLLITNKKTLNKTEEEILNDVIDAFNVLYDLEQELEATTPMAVQNDTMPVESLSRLADMVIRSESRSYTRKYLTSNVITQYENIKTNFGNTLGHCIRSNAIFHDSLYPRATDGDCYSKYRLFFTPILYEVNGIHSTSHNSKPEYGIASENTQYMINHRDILSYRVRFVRNFEEFPYPNALSSRDREDVERIIVDTFQEFPVEIEGKYIRLNKIKSSMYYEDFIYYKLLPELSEVEKASGCSRDWPNNRGIFFINKMANYPDLVSVVLVNITEHIKVMIIDPSGKCLHACYDQAATIMRFLDLRFENLYSRKSGYGFLTSFPQSVGCGLRISAKVYLKNLGDNREIMERKCQTLNFVYRGTFGAGSPAVNNVFDFSLKNNMNVTEKWILLTFCQRLKELLLAEREYDCRIPKPLNCVFYKNDSSKDEASTDMLLKSPDPLTDVDLQSDDITIEKTDSEYITDRKDMTSVDDKTREEVY